MTEQRADRSAIIHLDSVTKQYGGRVTALDHVSLDIAAGAFTAIMGPSGSGKSTLMHIAAGLDSATSGRVVVDGTDITTMDDKGLTELRRRRIGFVFQSFNLVPTLDVAENIRLPILLDGRKPTTDETAWIDELVGRLGLTQRMTHRPSELSGGQQQRVAIARALATRPSVVFADEPTGALDSRTGRDVLGILRDAVRDYGQSVVMVTHDPVAASNADRIVFLSDGGIRDDRGALPADEISRLMLTMEAAA